MTRDIKNKNKETGFGGGIFNIKSALIKRDVPENAFSEGEEKLKAMTEAQEKKIAEGALEQSTER